MGRRTDLAPFRRRVNAACSSSLCSCIAAPAIAQAYPAKPVRYILPSTGASEIVGRLIAQGLTDQLGQQFFVDVRPGAGSNLGAELGSEGTGGRLYADAAHAVAYGEREPLSHARLRRAPRFHAHHAHDFVAAHRRRASVAAGENDRRSGEARQGEAGGDRLLIRGRRHVHVPRRRAVQGDGGDRPRRDFVSRRRRRTNGRSVGRSLGVFRACRDGPALRARRTPARPGGRQRCPHTDAARVPDGRGIRLSRLRIEQLARVCRTRQRRRRTSSRCSIRPPSRCSNGPTS